MKGDDKLQELKNPTSERGTEKPQMMTKTAIHSKCTKQLIQNTGDQKTLREDK